MHLAQAGIKTGTTEYSNELLDSIKDGEFLD
jgi:hypothetical protein